jgi:hypothetical protein
MDEKHFRLIHTYHAFPLPCGAAKGVDCVFPIWFTQCSRVWFTYTMPRPCHAMTMSFWKRLLKAMAQRDMSMEVCVWISIGRPETACGRPACVRLLPTTTRSSTKDTALSESGRGTARHVWMPLDFFFGGGGGEHVKGEHLEFLVFQYCCSMHEV